ncbi:Ferric uptake regulation protein [subsurface metagenome]
MDTTKQIFKTFILGKNLRYTHQRDMIIEELYLNPGHYTPEEFYDIIKSKHPGIGKATVYRNLKLLEEAKIIVRVEFGDGHFRYELCLGREHHDHLICEKCRKSVEVIDPQIETLQEILANKHGFHLTGHRLYLYGLCEKCRNK